MYKAITSHQSVQTRIGMLVTFLICTLLSVQCSPDPVQIGTIKTTDVTVTSSEIAFTGTTNLKIDACIETLLYEDNEAITWWPSACVATTNGQWDIQVTLNIDDHDLKADATYTLRTWYRDDPSVSAEPFTFDMQGPVKLD